LITKKIPWPARGLSNGCSRVLRRHPHLRSEEGQRLGLAHGLRSTLADLTPRPMDPWQRFNAQGAQYTPQVIWTDVRAIVEPASRLATRVMERLDRR
jgi:hypothetical protein